jgi:hypothetical protein
MRFVSVSPSWNLADLQKARRRSDFGLFLVVFIVALGLAPLLILGGLNIGFGLLIGLLIALGIAVLTLCWPIFGLFIALLSALIIEESTLHLGTDFTDQLYVFSWPNSFQGLFDRPIGFLFLFMLAILIVLQLARRKSALRGGPLILPFGLFMLCVVLGVVHGLTSGGQVKVIVVEVRPLWYLFVSYLLAYNLISSSKHVRAFFWIVILAAGVKGLQGLYLYIGILKGSLAGHDELMAHEDSFFFVSLLLIIVLFCWQHRHRAQLIAALLVLVPVVISLVANQRRSDYIALLLGLIVSWSLIFVMKPQARKMLKRSALITLVIGGSYVVAFSHNQGAFASPARSVIAVFSPSKQDIRDVQSNLYRVTENHDLRYTELQNPILGAGFGKPFLTPWPLIDISADDQYYNYIPHNTIYWIWMRLGPVGYLLLWYLFGSIIVRGSVIVRNLRDPYLQMVGIYVVAITFMGIVIAFADYQLFFYRDVIYMGLLFGLLMKLPVIDGQEMQISSSGEQRALELKNEKKLVVVV